MIPLLSPKPFAAYAPTEYKEYIRSLYIAPPPPPVPAEFSVSTAAKGGFRLTVRREPKWLSSAEVGEAALLVGWPLQKMWQEILKRKVEIKVPKKAKRL